MNVFLRSLLSSLHFRRLTRMGIIASGGLILFAAGSSGLNVAAQSGTPNGAPPTNTPSVPQVTRRAVPSTNTPALTPIALTLEATASPTLTLVPSATDFPTQTFTPSPLPTDTPTIPPTETAVPVIASGPRLVIEGTYSTPNTPLVTEIPPSAPLPVESGDDVMTIMLLGSDTTERNTVSRTDVIILLAINKTAGTVSMLHLPRDLFVYVPNGNMEKINTVVSYSNKFLGAGTGIDSLKATLLYNFGIQVDHYARVDFTGFQDIINKLGGLQVSVDCAIEGNRLISTELNPFEEASYERYIMNVGRQTLDGYMALWYVRSRGSSSDLDRGRRQMDVLRAMWRQGREAGLFAQIGSLWPEVQAMIDSGRLATDLTLQDILGLAPFALSVDPGAIQRISLQQKVHFTEWYTTGTGQFVWLPIPDAMQTAVQNWLLPPSRNRLGGELPTVEVASGLPYGDYDKVAADRLSWEGFAARSVGSQQTVQRDFTIVYDYTGGAKPGSLKTLLRTLRTGDNAVVSQPDPNATVDFRVEMGKDYGMSCLLALPPLPEEALAAATAATVETPVDAPPADQPPAEQPPPEQPPAEQPPPDQPAQ